MRRVLIFEPKIQGHHFEFLAYLIRYANKLDITDRLAIAIHSEFIDRYQKFYPQEDLYPKNFAYFHVFDDKELGYITDPLASNLRQLKRIYNMMHHHAKLAGADTIHYDSFNVLQLFTICERKDLPKLSCIYYGPYTRIQLNGSEIRSIRQFLDILRRKINFKIAISSNRYESVFILNDSWSTKILKQTESHCCKNLPDPIWDSTFYTIKQTSIKKEKDERKHVLFFGTLREDKGSILLLKALATLPTIHQKRLLITYAGLVPKNERKRFETQLQLTRRKAPDLIIKYKEGYTTYTRAAELYNNSDIVALPYIRSDRSSGVLNNSVLFKRDVLASADGLIGSIVSKYRLGHLVSPLNEQSLSLAIVKWLDGKESKKSEALRVKFLEEHSPEKYAKCIFKGIGSKQNKGVI